MYLFVVALHVVLCLFLILIILLQPGKGGDVGAAFGGGSSSSFFGPRGPTSLLQQATTGVAVMFMVTSITLSLYSDRSTMSDANVDDELRRLQEEEAGDDTPAEGAEVDVEGGTQNEGEETP